MHVNTNCVLSFPQPGAHEGRTEPSLFLDTTTTGTSSSSKT